MRCERRRRALVACCVVLACLVASCTDRKATADVGPLPVAPTAYPTGAASNGPGVSGVSEDIQALTIRIANGQFDADVYTAESRPIRLQVWASGGPYKLTIDNLLDPRPVEANVPAGDPTVIGLTLPTPGRYTMHLSGAGTDTATLDVRAPGDR
jgi:hypothetical protein